MLTHMPTHGTKGRKKEKAMVPVKQAAEERRMLFTPHRK